MSSKAVFQVRYLSGQVNMGSKGALDSRQNQLQTRRGCNHAGNALGVFKTVNPSLKRGVHANWVAVDHSMPT